MFRAPWERAESARRVRHRATGSGRGTRGSTFPPARGRRGCESGASGARPLRPRAAVRRAAVPRRPSRSSNGLLRARDARRAGRRARPPRRRPRRPRTASPARPRFWKAAKAAGLKALVGAEVVLDEARPPAATSRRARSASSRPLRPPGLPPRARHAPRGEPDGLPEPLPPPHRRRARQAEGAGRGLVGRGRRARRGAPRPDGRRRGAGPPRARAGRARRRARSSSRASRRSSRAASTSSCSGTAVRDEEHRNRRRSSTSPARSRLPLVATNGVRYARRSDKDLSDVLTCIRHHTTLDAAGPPPRGGHRERHLKGAGGDGRASSPISPSAVGGAADLADRLDFTLADLGYRFPDYPLPPGETPASFLRQMTWEGARGRFRPLTARAQARSRGSST